MKKIEGFSEIVRETEKAIIQIHRDNYIFPGDEYEEEEVEETVYS